MIKFAWVMPTEAFDAELHFRQDEEIFKLTLIQEEGKPAELALVIANPYLQKKIFPKPQGILTYRDPQGEIHCLFRGRLINTQQSYQKYFVNLTFTSCLRPLKEEWAEFLTHHPQLKEHYDPLFHKDPENPEAILASQPLCLYWHRHSGKLGLSHAFKHLDQSKHWRLESPSYDPQSLSYRQETPIGSVNITASAQWVQHLDGFMDIAPYIADQFDEKMINTYTGKAFSNSWPKPGTSLGRSGYRVLYSALEETNAPFYAPLKRHRQALTLYHPVPNPQEPWRQDMEKRIARRSWFRGELLIGWHYRQKRKEEISFTLQASLPPEIKEVSQKNLSFSLQKLTQYEDLPSFTPFTIYEPGSTIHFKGKVYQYTGPKDVCLKFAPNLWQEVPEKTQDFFLAIQDSFFTTPRGIQAFEYALDCAKTYLTWHTRCFYVQAKGSLDWAPITTHDTAELSDHRLPGGRTEGKVVKYILTLEGASRPIVHLTLACRVGLKAPDPILGPPQPVYAQDYADPEVFYYEQTPKTSRGITYLRYDHHQPQDLFRYRIYAHIKAMVEAVLIKNKPQEQENFLALLSSSSSSVLKDKETKISLQFQRLQGQECLIHRIPVDILHSWFDS